MPVPHTSPPTPAPADNPSPAQPNTTSKSIRGSSLINHVGIDAAGLHAQNADEATDAAQLISLCKQMLDAPDDLPITDRAFCGLAHAMDAMGEVHSAAASLGHQIRRLTPSAVASAATGATLMALRGRTGRHLLYALAVDLGAAMQSGKTPDRDIVRLVGAWLLRRCFQSWQPPGSALSHARSIIRSTVTAPSGQWSNKARARSLDAALKALKLAMESNPIQARQLGLSIGADKEGLDQVRPASHPIGEFNRRFRRRTNNLVDYSTLTSVAGAGGYGTLSAAALKHAGQELLALMQTGDVDAALISLGIVTRLTADVLTQLPLSRDGNSPPDALAWLNAEEGCYYRSLYRMIERGARPHPGTEHLYEATDQIVRVQLSPPIQAVLLQRLTTQPGALTLGELLGGPPIYSPRSAVVGSGAYRCTARRLQESVPTLLLDSGQHRWPVALAWNAHALVSRGRVAYGACSARSVQLAANAGYQLLGWPAPNKKFTEHTLIGAYTTPSRHSVRGIFKFLQARADAIDAISYANRSHITSSINAHAVWVSALLAFVLGLRRWIQYRLRLDELLEGIAVAVNDKDVHEVGDPPVPIAHIGRDAIRGWVQFVESASSRLEELGDATSIQLAAKCRERLEDVRGTEGVFTTDPVGRLQPIGYQTWYDVLPDSLKLKPNFGRQFWPMALMDAGIPQTLIDIFMRHQIDGLHPGSSSSARRKAAAEDRLRNALNEVIADLHIDLPKQLRHS